MQYGNHKKKKKTLNRIFLTENAHKQKHSPLYLRTCYLALYNHTVFHHPIVSSVRNELIRMEWTIDL